MAEIRKMALEELGAIIARPRAILRGIGCEDADQMPTRQDFTLDVKHDVPGMGEVRMIVQTGAPRMTFQLIEAESEAQFDDYLSKLLGMHDNPSYIEGRTDFMVLFQGSQDGQEITQENHREVYQRICHTQDQAARWWHLYGSEKPKPII